MGMEEVETVARFAAVCIAANISLRTIMAFIGRKFGAWHPAIDAYWPRLWWSELLWKPYVRVSEWWEENFKSGKKATAGFASWLSVLSTRYKPGDILLGRARLPFGIPYHAAIGEPSDKHCWDIGQARSGKSQMMAARLALHNGAAFVIDPFGDFSKTVLLSKIEQGFQVVIVDPFGILNGRSGALCLLAQIKAINERMGDDLTTMLCDRLAAITFPQTGKENPFFVLTPRSLWAALMAFALVIYDRPTMLDVRRLLNFGFREEAGGDPVLGLEMLWEAMAACPVYPEFIGAAGVEMMQADSQRTRPNILSTARSRTKFFDHQQVRKVSARNDALLTDLKKDNSKLIISMVAPVGELRTTLKEYFAQWMGLTVAMFELIPGNISPRAILMADELQSFGGGIVGLSESFATLGGRGLSVHAATQDLSGLSEAFDEYQSMLSNASHISFYATEDPMTLGYIAKHVLGEKTIKTKRKSGDVQTEDRPTMTIDQLRRFLNPKRGNVLVKRSGRSFRLKAMSYHADIPAYLAKAHPEFPEKPMRAAFRAWYPKALLHWRRVTGQTEQPMSEKQARAVFGLEGRFSAQQLKQRTRLLSLKYQPEQIAPARKTLEQLL